MPARYGSDLIVDLLKALGIEYVALNPGSSFRGIQDSLVNYNGNRSFTVYKELPKLSDGWVTLTEKPGLGVELNENTVKEFQVK